MRNTTFNLAMIVEDGILDALLAKNLLISNDIAEEVLIFNDPVEAYEYIAKASKARALNYLPDLLILDINLPHFSGFELLDKCKSISELSIKGTKVIMTSSSDDIEDIKKSAEYKNVINYFIKPLHTIDFMNIEYENVDLRKTS